MAKAMGIRNRRKEQLAHTSGRPDPARHRRYYLEDGKNAQVIREGDVVKIPPDVKH
jgi:hypothetical protein